MANPNNLTYIGPHLDDSIVSNGKMQLNNSVIPSIDYSNMSALKYPRP